MPGWVIVLELVVIIGLLFGIYRTLDDVVHGSRKVSRPVEAVKPELSVIRPTSWPPPPPRSTNPEELKEEL